jgi:hypothetical protein
MNKPYTGGCACGAIRYEIAAEPVFSNECQCRQCQQVSGTGHGSYMSFVGREAIKVEGNATHWTMTADSGKEKTRSFCPACGAPVYQTYPAMPDVITIHAASLDEPGWYRPQAVTYASRAHDWDRVDPALVKFETMPPAP